LNPQKKTRAGARAFAVVQGRTGPRFCVVAAAAGLTALAADVGHVIAILVDRFAALATRLAGFAGIKLLRVAAAMGGLTASHYDIPPLVRIHAGKATTILALILALITMGWHFVLPMSLRERVEPPHCSGAIPVPTVGIRWRGCQCPERDACRFCRSSPRGIDSCVARIALLADTTPPRNHARRGRTGFTSSCPVLV
jgi:hypothetical protein